MARFILAIAAFLLSIYVSASEAASTHVAKTETLKQTELSVESGFTAPLQTEKHFLPTAEYQLTAVKMGYVVVSQYVPVHTVEISSLNNRGPPATAL